MFEFASSFLLYFCWFRLTYLDQNWDTSLCSVSNTVVIKPPIFKFILTLSYLDLDNVMDSIK